MKHLYLIIATFLITFPAFGQTAFHPVGKEGANLNYTFQEDCEKAEGQACFDVYSCPPDECILIDEVDDIGIYTGKKLLRNSPVRKAAKEAKLEAEKQAIIDVKLNRKDRASKAKTIAELKAILLELLEKE
jgi:hypothetical protein